MADNVVARCQAPSAGKTDVAQRHSEHKEAWCDRINSLASPATVSVPSFGKFRPTRDRPVSSVPLPVLTALGPYTRPQTAPVITELSSAARRERLEMSRTLLYNSLEDLEGPGVVPDGRGVHCSAIYFYLCTLNAQGFSCPGVNLPSTLLVTGGLLRFWFSQCPVTRQLRMRNVLGGCGVSAAEVKADAFHIPPDSAPVDASAGNRSWKAVYIDFASFFSDIDGSIKHLTSDGVVNVLSHKSGTLPNGVLQECGQGGAQVLAALRRHLDPHPSIPDPKTLIPQFFAQIHRVVDQERAVLGALGAEPL